MTDAHIGMVLIAFILSMLAALVIVAGYNRLRRGARPSSEAPGEPAARAGGAAEKESERKASAPAELMQAIVRRYMASDPAFSGRSIDFGTAPDGSLEIWFGGRSYSGVEEIPDARLRDLIARAAVEFNQGGPAAP